MTNEPRLFLGDLELTQSPTGEVGFNPFVLSVLAEGADLGDPEPVEQAIRSLLRDGELVSTVSYGNRQVVFLVTVTAATAAGLAEGELALALQTGKRNTLDYYPGGIFGAPTRFQVLTSAIQYDYDDEEETFGGERTYRLVCTCLPFGESLAEVTVTAPNVSTIGAATTIDSGSSTVNTTAIGGTTKFVDTTATRDTGVTSAATAADQLYTFDASYSVSQSGVDPGPSRVLSASISADNIAFTPVTVFSLGWVGTSERYAFQAGVSWRYLRVSVRVSRPGNATPAVQSFTFGNVARRTVGGNYSLQTFAVRGSSRAPGSVHTTAAEALGEVLVATIPEDKITGAFRPDVRTNYLNAGTATLSANAQSFFTGGAYNFTTKGTASNPRFDVPAITLRPGSYQVVLRSTRGANNTQGVTAQLVSGAGGTPFGEIGEVTNTFATASANLDFNVIGFIELPPQRTDAPAVDLFVRLIPYSSAAFVVDDIYLLPAEADVSIFNLGTGTLGVNAASNHLWIDAPDQDQPSGGYWRGITTDRSNLTSAIPVATALGLHNFSPGNMRVFVAAETTGAVTDFTYVPHWFTHAGE